MRKYPEYKASGVDWLGEIPSGWNATLLKRSLNEIKDGTHGSFKRPEEGKPLLSAKNVQSDKIDISESESVISEEDYNSIIRNGYPKKNDLLLTIVGTIGRAYVYDLDYPLAFQRSVAFLRFKRDNNIRFYYYQVQSSLFLDQLFSLAKTSAQSGVYLSDIKGSIALIPPLPEQHSIVRFLDYKTGQIDRFIANRQKQIELLKEQKAAIINKAVTKGINPNAKMKPSGIEWLEEVPEHWKKLRLKNLTTRITNGFVGSTSNILKESGVRYIQALHVKQNTIIFNVPYYVGEDWSNDHPRSILKEGDIVITQTGAMTGDVGLVPKEFAGCNCHALIIVKSDQRKVIPAYLLNLLASKFGNSLLESIRTGSMHPHLNSTIVCDINLSIPEEIKEQQSILDFINTEISTIDNLISKYQKQIDLMQEYRTSIISQAVTGKIDVRDWQPKAREYKTDELTLSIAAEK